METMIVKQLKVMPSNAQQVPEALDMAGVEWNKVDHVNWEFYPYHPSMEFRMAHAGTSFCIQYRVREQTVRALAATDNGNVWEDSCCEFFCQPDENPLYYNFECNCAGTLLLACGTGRNDRQQAPLELVATIDRWSSLGKSVFKEKPAPEEWTLALIIPTNAFFKHKIGLLNGLRMRANIYKCGDKLSVPHFLSWNPIKTDTPDFHRPEFFGEVIFE